MITEHRRNFVCDGGDLSPPLLKVVVTVTGTGHWSEGALVRKLYSRRVRVRVRVRFLTSAPSDQ